MNPKLKALLTELADLLEKYDGGITVIDYDASIGIHVDDGKHEAAIGYPSDGDVSDIRALLEQDQ